MWSAMSREISYQGIANVITAFLATTAGWGAENDSRKWARNTMANWLQQFVEPLKSPELVFQHSILTSLTLSVLCGQESKHHDLATRAPFPQKEEGSLIAEWLQFYETATGAGGMRINNRRRYICRNTEQLNQRIKMQSIGSFGGVLMYELYLVQLSTGFGTTSGQDC